MQALSVELEDETVAALEAERELFGFESRQAYVRWIIDHRGSIDADGYEPEATRDRLLADHDRRLDRLEERVAALADSRLLERDDDDSDTASVDDRSAGPEDSNSDATRAADDGRDSRRGGDADSSSETVREPILEVHGSPRTVRQGPDSTVRSDDGDETDSSAIRDPSSGGDDRSTAKPKPATDSAADGSDSDTLSPERVARIPEDPVHEDAGVLGNVESERLDELSRRAVATTRKRLNRDVQTGLEYTSSTRLAGSGVRPGEDVADLDALSVPGRSASTVEKRRHAVGQALAYLRDEGRARRSDFVDALYPECPAEYDTADGWWRCIKSGLRQVDAVDGGDGARVWQYRE